MDKIKIESDLLERAKRAAAAAGYSGVEEFVAHCVENELKKHKVDEVEASGGGPASRPGIHRMMDAVTQIVVWLNAVADALGRRAPGAHRPARRRGFRPRPSRRSPAC